MEKIFKVHPDTRYIWEWLTLSELPQHWQSKWFAFSDHKFWSWSVFFFVDVISGNVLPRRPFGGLFVYLTFIEYFCLRQQPGAQRTHASQSWWIRYMSHTLLNQVSFNNKIVRTVYLFKFAADCTTSSRTALYSLLLLAKLISSPRIFPL